MKSRILFAFIVSILSLSAWGHGTPTDENSGGFPILKIVNMETTTREQNLVQQNSSQGSHERVHAVAAESRRGSEDGGILELPFTESAIERRNLYLVNLRRYSSELSNSHSNTDTGADHILSGSGSLFDPNSRRTSADSTAASSLAPDLEPIRLLLLEIVWNGNEQVHQDLEELAIGLNMQIRFQSTMYNENSELCTLEVTNTLDGGISVNVVPVSR